MPFSLPTYARTVFHVSLHNQVRGHAIFEVVLTNRQPPASHNFIHHPREMTPTILSRTMISDHNYSTIYKFQISTEYHLPVHGLPSVLRRVPLGNGSSRSHSLYHHQPQPEHFPQLRTGGAIGPHVRTPCSILLLPCVMVYYIVSVLFLLFFWCPCMAINVSVQYNGGLLPDIVLLTQ